MSYIEHLTRFEKAIEYADTVETAEALAEARDRFRAACQPQVEALVEAVAGWREAQSSSDPNVVTRNGAIIVAELVMEQASFALDARADEVAGGGA